MTTYTPPDGDAVNFTFEGSYEAPTGANVNFLFGVVSDLVQDSSIETVYTDDGFDQVVIRWTSDIDGDYRIEMGGTGVTTGDLMASGYIIADVEFENIITSDMITTASGYLGVGTYRFNMYVQSSDGIWNPYYVT
jgi:hypothetical protein